MDFSKIKKPLKISLILIVKIAVSYLLLKAAFSKINFHSLSSIFSELKLKNALVITLLILANWSLQVCRWHLVLKYNHIKISLFETIKSYFAGYSFRLLIPGGYAEFMKVFFINGKRSYSLGAFGLETLIVSFTQVFLLAVAGLFLLPDYQWIWLTIGTAAIAGVVFFPLLRKINLLSKILKSTVFDYKLSAGIIGITLISLAIINTQYHYILKFHDTIAWIQVAAVVIFIMSSGIVPMTFAGLGVRENVAIFLLGLFGIAAERAVSLTLFIYVTNIIIPAVIGLVFLLTHKLHLKFTKPSSEKEAL